jgi:beta-phosphoglucomutase-like phosphatase (HAD superfamily)
MPIQALIFDCDGTLADSMPMHWRAWKQVTDQYQLSFPKDRFYSLGGVPAPDILKMLAAEQGRELDYMKAAKEKEAAFARQIPEIQVIPLIVGIARDHYGKIPMAVASGGTRRVVNETLRHMGIENLFQAVVTTEDVTRQKPAPDIFLEAARRLGVAPQFCRGYEDTDLGLQAIRAAGMEAVDVRPLLGAALV